MKKSVTLYVLLVLMEMCWVSSVIVANARASQSVAVGHAEKQTFQRACAVPPRSVWWQASCLSIFAHVPAPVKALAATPGPDAPYKPASLHMIYHLPTIAPKGQTIAVVDAYDNPGAESDLAVYRSMFGIPACTSANGCFRKVDQNGGTSYPASNVGWSAEISSNLDMVSAICYNCHILLVEAKTSSIFDLGTAVNTAVRLGATAISNSYGSDSEIGSESKICQTYYNHPGVAITASSGDSGLGLAFPSVCPHVVSVGGTSLHADGHEVVWNTRSVGAGGGCSVDIPRSDWQSSSVTGCQRRAVADVSALADPTTGVYVYTSYGITGWLQIGGTSVSAPIIAAVYALSGGIGKAEAASLPWGKHITACLNTVGGKPYSYQGGLGSPDGLACF